MVDSVESRPIEPLDLLGMRVPASTAAKWLEVTPRQVRKARQALFGQFENEALRTIRNLTPNIDSEVAWKLHYEWCEKDHRLALEKSVWRALAQYRLLYEQRKASIVSAKQAFYAAELELMVGKRTEAQVDVLRIEFARVKGGVDEALQAYEDARTKAANFGVSIDRHRSVGDYRDLLAQGKPEKPKNKKGGGDVHGHHKPSDRQLMDAAGR